MKSEGNKIYKSVSEHNFTQRLHFSYCKRDTFINIADVINVNKIKSRELFIKTFFNIFIWMLQFTVITKLLFIADFFNPWDGDWFTLDCCDGRTQIYEIISGNRDSESDRDCWSYSDDFGSQEVIVWSSFGFGRCSISSCNSTKLMMFKLL